MDSTSQSQINELNKFIKSRQDSRELKRAIAVKLALEKYSYLEIKSILNVSPSFITKWKKIFLSQGIKHQEYYSLHTTLNYQVEFRYQW